ncbi:MAG: Rieske (2Fe-2S) protein [Rhodospirillaceae bacterium]|nr:Rieske (2Fe-2S) protein [Rhodospirillaceae bacterium]|tara:strand:- start:4478 stop:5620 length:1143 start_codon:yes stop_codon:yes gene_type:complete
MPGLDSLLHEIGRTAALPFEQAVTLPREAYTDPDFTALEVARLFEKDWVCVGRADEIPEPGDYLTHRVVSTPVMVVRQADGSLKALVNACRHRSAELLQGIGHAAKIVCPYHAWSYNLEGTLQMAPFMGPHFDKKGVCLPKLRLDQWEGWLYVTLDDAVAPISERLGSLSQRVDGYHMADHVMIHRDEKIWQCNWKTLAENFTESYHLFSSHKTTLQPFTPTQGVWCETGDTGWNIHWMDTSRPQDKVFDDSTDEIRSRFPLMHVYPSHVVSASLMRGFWMSLQPEGPDAVRVLWGVTIARQSLPDDAEERTTMATEIAETFEAVNWEDQTIVESIARSLKSTHAARGRLGEKERTMWEFWRYLATTVGAPMPSDAVAAE